MTMAPGLVLHRWMHGGALHDCNLLVKECCKCRLGAVGVVCGEQPCDAVLQSIACGFDNTDVTVA